MQFRALLNILKVVMVNACIPGLFGTLPNPVPNFCQVGASNELPESEGLDALFDRFLIRTPVKQLSPVGLVQMLTGVSSRGGSNGSKQLRQRQQHQVGDNTAVEDVQLTRADILSCREEALDTVTVPPRIIRLMADLRAHLQVRGAWEDALIDLQARGAWEDALRML